jgi:hypothetical protein
MGGCSLALAWPPRGVGVFVAFADGAAWAKLARALYIVSPAVTMSADARNRLCGVYHTEFIRSSLEIRISVREVETLASFILRFCVHPHRAFPCCAPQRTAGFPKYEALRGFDWTRFVVRRHIYNK